jgi:hypothetical protein
LEVGGDHHGRNDAHIRAAGIARRVTTEGRAGNGDYQADDLPGDLTAIAVTESVAEHREVGSHVGDGEWLAEDVGPLEVTPFGHRVAPDPGLTGGGPLVAPCIADCLPWRRRSGPVITTGSQTERERQARDDKVVVPQTMEWQAMSDGRCGLVQIEHVMEHTPRNFAAPVTDL